MVLARFGCVAVLLLSACSLFESEATRREKAYERYVGQSREAKERRQNAAAKQEAAIPEAPVQQRQDVQTGGNAAPVPPPGLVPVQPPPEAAPASSP